MVSTDSAGTINTPIIAAHIETVRVNSDTKSEL